MGNHGEPAYDDVANVRFVETPEELGRIEWRRQPWCRVSSNAAANSWAKRTSSEPSSSFVRPADGSTIRSPVATVGFTATEPGSVFDCSPDGASFALCSSPQSLTGLSDGPHTLTVRAIDPVGNPGPVSILRFAVDTSRPPEPRIVRLPTDPRNCALQVFRARMTPRGLKVVMRSEVQRLVKIQLYRRHGPVIGPRRLSVYLGKSVPRTTVRFIRMARIRRSRRVRSYVRLGRARGVVIRIVPRVINEVRGCNQGGRVGARDEVGYASRFARKVVLGSSRR